MAYSRNIRIGDGATNQFTLNFTAGYLNESDITCRVGTEVDGLGQPSYRTITFINENLVQISGAIPAIGEEVLFDRNTIKTALAVDFADGDTFTEGNLDTAHKQLLFLVHETLDGKIPEFERISDDLESTHADALRAEVAADAAEAALALIVTNASPVTLESFGGFGDGILDVATDVLISGTDNAAAMDAMIAYMKLNKVHGRLGSGVFRLSRGATNDSGFTIRGEGPEHTTVYVECGASEACLRNNASGSVFKDMRIISAPTAVKTANNGQYHACVLLGENYYTPTAQSKLFNIGALNLECRRANNAIAGSCYGVFGIGNIQSAEVDLISTTGTKRRMSGAVQFHWSAHSTAAYGAEPITTYHSNGVRIGSVHGENVDAVVTISSVYDLSTSNITGDNCSSLLLILVGDEADSKADASVADLIGKRIRIGDVYGKNMSNDSADAISITSLGTSTWQKYPLDAAIALKRQVALDVSIGSVLIDGSINTNKKLIDAFEVIGKLHVGHVHVVNTTHNMEINVNRSNADVVLDDVSGNCRVEWSMSKALTWKRGAINIANITTNAVSTVGLYSFGQYVNVTLAADIAVSDTTMLISAVAEDLCVGDILRFGAAEVIVTEFCEAGVLHVPIAPQVVAITSGSVLSLDKRCVIDAQPGITGGYYSIDLSGTDATLHGDVVRRCGYRGMKIRNSSRVTLNNPRIVDNGILRAVDPIAYPSTGDMEIELGSFVSQTGGELGGPYTRYNVYASTADAATDARFLGTGVRFRGFIDGAISASSPFDVKLLNCTDKDGFPVLAPRRFSWTPSIVFGTSPQGTATSTVTVAEYEIDENNIISGMFDITTTSAQTGGAGSAEMRGMPKLPSRNDIPAGDVIIQFGATIPAGLRLRTLTTGMRFTSQGTASFTNLADTAFPSGTRIVGEFKYRF